MKIVTHPDNKKHLDQILEHVTNEFDAIGVRPARLDGFEIVYTCVLPQEKPSKTEFVARHDRFCEYNTSEPSEWEIFCGYVVPKMEPNFMMIDDRRYTFMRNGSPEVHTW